MADAICCSLLAAAAMAQTAAPAQAPTPAPAAPAVTANPSVAPAPAPANRPTATDKAAWISRRGFLALTASLASCTAAPPLASLGRPTGPRPQANAAGPAAGPRGPVPRNPDMPFGSDFSAASGVTFTRVPGVGNYIAITFDENGRGINERFSNTVLVKTR